MTKRILLLISRLILGAVFTFSGFVKVIDPLGFTYKIEDYLAAMGPLMESLSPLAFVAAILLTAIELVIGLNLLLGAKIKINTIAAGILMVFMTPLTLWIAIANPVHDCGCFGDALVITNWETFWKNILLSIFVLTTLFLNKQHKSKIGNKTQWIMMAYAFIFSIGLSIYCLIHLPIIDFRPYKIGTDIEKSMEIPIDAEADLYDIKLIYEKDGVQKEFTLENYPKDDSWAFVDQKSVLIRKGYEPPIHDFSMETEDGDITYDMLANQGYTFLLVSYDINKAETSRMDKINKAFSYAKANDFDFYGMTSSVSDDIVTFKEKSGAKFPFVSTDKITLKTIIRSNPGLVLIKNGIIINKWACADIPDFSASLENDKLGEIKSVNNLSAILMSFLIFILPLSLILIIDKFLKNRRD